MGEIRLRRLPGIAWRVVLFELQLYWSLVRWVVRRPSLGGEGTEPVTYARTVTPVMWLWIFASALELPLVHVLVPWETVRFALLVVGVWGLLWMVGLLASLWVHPHLLGPSGLRVRYGASTDVVVPWSRISRVTSEHRDLASSVRSLQPVETERGRVLQVAVSGQVNVHLTFDEPVTLETQGLTESRRQAEYVGLSLFADDPRQVAEQLRRRTGLTRPGRP